jgi:predicted transposase/invertase (TIGR01784 family)
VFACKANERSACEQAPVARHRKPERAIFNMPIIDVKLVTKSKKVSHIEIQLRVTPELKNRIILYDSKLIAEQIGSGDNYDEIKQVVSIIITDEELIKGSPRYHHRFTFYDREAGVEFSDLIEIHSLELRKLPEGTDGTKLYDWARFIAAESDDEMDRAAARNPEVKKAVVKFRELTADERTRDLFERREKARRDQAMFMRHERQLGLQEGLQQGMPEGMQQGLQERSVTIARSMITDGESIDKIMRYTGLTREEIESLM